MDSKVEIFECLVVGCGRRFDCYERLAQHREEEHPGQGDGVAHEKIHQKERSDGFKEGAPQEPRQELGEYYLVGLSFLSQEITLQHSVARPDDRFRQPKPFVDTRKHG